MISFSIGKMLVNIADPWRNLTLLLILIILTILVYFFMIYTRRKRVSHFGNIHTLQKVHGFKRFYINPLILFVKIIIIILLFLAATDSVDMRVQRPTTDVDYVIVLDSSPSMALDDYDPDRLTAAKQISQDWITMIPNGTAVGLVVFSDSVIEEIPLSHDMQELYFEVDDVRINYSRSGTAIEEALSKAVDMLSESDRNRSILLLTDATEEIGNDTIAKINQFEVSIHAFGIGNNESEDLFEDEELLEDIPENFTNYYTSLDFNFEKLQDLSNQTTGSAYRVSSIEELDMAFRQATLEQIQIELDSQYYVSLLIALLSILEFVIYSKIGGL